MFDNLNKKFQQILTNMDPETLKKGLKTMSDIMNTPEGQKLAEQFKNMDKQKLMEQLNNVSETEMVEKLDNMDINQITDKMNSIDKDQLMKDLSSNPEILKKINEMMNNK